MNSQALNLVQILPVILLTENYDLTCLNALVVIGLLNSCPDINSIDALSHSVCNLSRNLASVIPVCLVSVIILGIVRCSDIDTGNCMKSSYHVRQLRCRAKAWEGINLDAVSRKDTCCQLRKLS